MLKQQQNTSFSSNFIKLATINCNGLRQKEKRLKLGHVLPTNGIGVVVITETHFRENESKMLRIPRYRIIGEYTRPEPQDKIGGGVIILTHKSVTAVGLNLNPAPQFPLETCAAIIYPKHQPQFRMRVIGFYVPPIHTKLLSSDLLSTLGNPMVDAKANLTLSSFVMGDFNIP